MGAAARRALGGGREVRKRGVAYVPPHLPGLAGRYRRTHRCAAEADASRLGFDHDERVWKCLDDGQAGGQQQGGQDGVGRRVIQCKKRQPSGQSQGALKAAALIWGYLGLALSLSGCGGLQRLKFTRNPIREVIG
jgi:hypothetical protein